MVSRHRRRQAGPWSSRGLNLLSFFEGAGSFFARVSSRFSVADFVRSACALLVFSIALCLFSFFLFAPDHVNVELDPVSQIEVSERISSLGQQCCGWYHSHPYFANDPSTIDVINQMAYQTIYKEEGREGEEGGKECGHSHSLSASVLSPLKAVDGMVPFVAAIITRQ